MKRVTFRLFGPTLLALVVATFSVHATATLGRDSGVRSAEDAWADAFVSGDSEGLRRLLSPAYVSVSSAGVVRTRDDIIKLCEAFSKTHPGQHGSPMSDTSSIEIFDHTALVRHASAGEQSIDLFRYEGGHWIAWYSQHTSVAR